MIEKSHRWQRTAIAAAAIALLGLSASEVSALSLGRITVQSALGEPLKAEIEVPNISTEEAASLKANVASPAAFVAAGLEYNPAMSGLQANLARRADGRSYIRLTSDRAINDPFIDMILEASWASGRIVRDYTMLFDPPSLKQTAPAPTLPQVTTLAPVPVQASTPAKPTSAPQIAQAAEPRKPAANAKPVVNAAPKAAAKSDSTSGQKVVVQAGDSASKIALRAKSDDVSLDQMLVALLRSNPDAFSKGNLNRLRAGAVLDMPSNEQAKTMSVAEAAQTVVAQSKDFNEFRRNLAGNAPKAAVETADRKAAGAVEAKVDDKKPGSSAADKLTLSKGALQAKADESRIAKERADKDAATRAAELAKNIADLNKLSSASANAKPPAVAASAPQATPAPVAVASAPAPVKPVASAPAKPKAPIAAPVPVAEPSLIDQLAEDPTLPLAGGGLLALLGGFFLYRRQQRKKSAVHVDSSFLDSRLQPDSFFGASGGQRVDTAQEGAAGSSSMAYTHSQLDSADDVDPVAEADVYLAYGRDAQAEEILKEAVRHNPGRLAIHSKLLEIYAKLRDTVNFQASAQNAFQLVGAESPDWARICELGLTIDPENPLYLPGGATPSAFGNLEQQAYAAASGNSTVPLSASPELAQSNADLDLDLDLDLDFSADDEPASAINDVTSTPPDVGNADETVKMQALEAPSNSIDFDISGPGELDASIEAAELSAELDPFEAPSQGLEPTQFDLPQALPDLSMSMEGLDLGDPTELIPNLPDFQPTGPFEGEVAVSEVPSTPSNEGMLEFDLGSLSLDLEPSVEDDAASLGDNSLETKLALAEEFVSIGDQDGARALIEEVVAEATGELREKAQRALANLS